MVTDQDSSYTVQEALSSGGNELVAASVVAGKFRRGVAWQRLTQALTRTLWTLSFKE